MIGRSRLHLSPEAGVQGPHSIRYRNENGPGNWTWAVQGAGDFDHDGRDDILWRHTSGQIAIWTVQGTRFTGELYPRLLDSSWKFKTLVGSSGF